MTAIASHAWESDWIGLPCRGDEIVVSVDQLLLCRHFIVAALFGAREALLRAGDISGPKVRRAEGERGTWLPVLAAEAVVAVGGYEFLLPGSPQGACRAGGKGRASVEGYADSDRGPHPDHRGPHPDDPRLAASTPARILLGPRQVAQLCDSGVLFRGAAR